MISIYSTSTIISIRLIIWDLINLSFWNGILSVRLTLKIIPRSKIFLTSIIWFCFSFLCELELCTWIQRDPLIHIGLLCFMQFLYEFLLLFLKIRNWDLSFVKNVLLTLWLVRIIILISIMSRIPTIIWIFWISWIILLLRRGIQWFLWNQLLFLFLRNILIRSSLLRRRCRLISSFFLLCFHLARLFFCWFCWRSFSVCFLRWLLWLFFRWFWLLWELFQLRRWWYPSLFFCCLRFWFLLICWSIFRVLSLLINLVYVLLTWTWKGLVLWWLIVILLSLIILIRLIILLLRIFSSLISQWFTWRLVRLFWSLLSPFFIFFGSSLPGIMYFRVWFIRLWLALAGNWLHRWFFV